MKNYIVYLLVMIVVICGCPVPSSAAEEPKLYAKAAVLMDADTGRVLYGRAPDEALPMASTTKIMTLILALEYGNPDDVVTVSSYAAKMPEVRLGLHAGDRYVLQDLLYSMMLESHNDSACAVAEQVGGSVEAFAQMMNRKAAEIGLHDTYFITPNGLDAKNENGFHHTTAADLSLIMRYCIKTSEMAEQFLTITREGQYQFSDIDGKNSYTCCNHNAFLQMMDGALSGKTGFTGNAGYCYVGALKRDDRTFIVALLACGWPNNKTYKWADTKKLMQYGISRFRKISLDEIELDAGEYAPVQVVDGQGTKIGEEVTTELEVAPVKENVELLIEKDQEVHIEYQLSRKLYASVTEGDFIGEITYLLGDEVLAKRVVTVKNTVKRIDFCWCVKKTAELFPM